MSKKFQFIDNDTGEITESEAFELADHTSAGGSVGDAGKPVILSSAGLLDPSMVPKEVGIVFYENIITGQTATVPSRVQYHVVDELTLDGEIDVTGTLVIL